MAAPPLTPIDERLPNTTNDSRIPYSSFSSEGVEYRLYDNVEVYTEFHPELYIGKIIKLWEEKDSGMRRVLIRWFFKHKEVNPNSDENPKELFLAFGKGKGVMNENALEVIVRKCKVLCTSKDLRNKQPSDIDLENADYYFSHIYNVDLERTSPVQKVADKLGCDAVYNKQEWVTENIKTGEKADELLKTNQKCNKDVTLKQEPQSVGSLPESKKRLRDSDVASDAQKRKLGQQSDLKKPQLISDEAPKNKKIKVLDAKSSLLKEVLPKAGGTYAAKLEEQVQSNNRFQKTEKASPLAKKDMDASKHAESASGFMKEEAERTQFVKASEIVPASISEVEKEAEGSLQADHEGSKPRQKKNDLLKDNSKSLSGLGSSPKGSLTKEVRSDVTKKLKIATGVDAEKKLMPTSELVKTVEKRKIFKELPWEENLQQGIPYGKVLLLQNFDPLVTSADVRDMLKSVFEGLSDARVLSQETICPYGQALAIFESKMLADSALEGMEKKCLVVTNNRPVIASKVKEPLKLSRFPGHLAFEKLKLSRNLQNEDYKRAVSTSHCSQPNTIEFEMAMEWRHLQEISHTCRAELFKKQRKEIDDIRRGSNKKG